MKPSYFRQIYYEALDFVINGIQKCFEKPVIKLMWLLKTY